jgi:hypothetical protein
MGARIIKWDITSFLEYFEGKNAPISIRNENLPQSGFTLPDTGSKLAAFHTQRT